MRKEKVFCVELKSRERFTRLLGDSSKAKGLRAGLVSLKPREEIGEHKTVNKEEVIIILKGNAVIYFGKSRKMRAGQGAFVYIPPETLHNIKNPGNKILQYVYVTNQVA